MVPGLSTCRTVLGGRGALLLAAALLAAPAALAQGQLSWVEVDLALDGDGRAGVTYQTRWRTSGTMHGFYFEGEAARPRFRGGQAELPGGRTVPLSITPAGANRWDVVLAGGEAWGPGEATYTFSYEADLAAAGFVDVTRPPDGPPLTVLNWSPVEWDEALEHHTLVARFTSVPAPRAGDLSLEDAARAGLRTEPWVNERYLISYRGEGSPPTLWVRFHQKDVPPRGEHRVQLYLPSGHFPGVAAQAERRLAARRAEEERRRAEQAASRHRRATVALPLLLAVGLVSLGLAGRKLKGLARAHATAPDVLWERDDWEPPRLRLSTFRKPGKVAELSDLEALTLLGLPFTIVLAMVIDLLFRRGRLRREEAGGALRLARLGDAPPEDDPYLAFAWKQLAEEPAPPPEGLAGRLGELLVGTVQRKAWDADLEATREHYRTLFESLFPDVEAVRGRRFGSEARYYPGQMCVNAEGLAFVADRNNNRVQVFSTSR